MRLHWEKVESLLHKESDDSVRIEHKIRSASLQVSDDGVERKKLLGLRENSNVWMSRHGDGGRRGEFKIAH